MVRPILFISALALTVSAAPRAAEPSQTDALVALEQRWMTAVKQQDIPAVDAVLAPDFTLTVAVSGAPLVVVPRAEYIEACRGYYVIHSFTFDEFQVRSYGDTATVTSRYRQSATLSGTEDRSAEFLLTDVWVRRDGKWLVTARYSSRPEPTPPTE